MNVSETICAPATTAGTGAIAIIRISGPEALEITDKVVTFVKGTAREARGYTLKRGKAGDIDDVVVAVFRAPHSYTGEDSTEIYCHSSSYIVSTLLDALCSAGCRLADPGEFTQRAFVNGKMDLAQAEAVADVIASASAAQHRAAINQLRGGFSSELGELRSQLLELTSLMELELDFSEEDVEFADRWKLRNLLDRAIAHCSALADSFKIGNAVRNGVPVAIVGAPNSGKSTLLNALLNEDRAIVSDIPGTTRDTVEETSIIGGVLFRFIDTAGLHESSDTIESLGIERSLRKLSEASIVLGVIDGRYGSLCDDAQSLISKVDPESQKLVILVNKSDDFGDNKNVIELNKLVSLVDQQEFGIKLLKISAKTGSGLEELRQTLVSLTDFDSASGTLVTNARHAAALRAAVNSLQSVSTGLDSGLTSDLLAEDLRSALDSLGTITGQVTNDEVLGQIFGKFCIGK